MKRFGKILIFSLVFCIVFGLPVFAADANLAGDMNGDGQVTGADAIYLLRHTMFPQLYPLKSGAAAGDVTIPGTEPTCTETGLTDGKRCASCDTVLVEQEIIPAKGHDEVTDTGTEPTCTETGLTDGKHCTECGAVTVEQKEIPAKGHDEVTDAGTEPTCTETGLTEGKHCTACGAVTVEQEEIPAKGHTETTVEGKAPTCTETGLAEGKRCTECGAVTVEQKEIPAKGHTEVIDEAKAPTCAETGLTEGKHCAECGEVLVAQEIVPTSDAHDYVDGKCTLCGAIQPTDSKYFIFKMLEDGTYSVAAAKEAKELEYIVIPETYAGKLVTLIDENGFYDFVNLKSITIPDSVTDMGEHTFHGCTALKSVKLSHSLTKIGYGTFCQCTSLESIVIPASVEMIDEYAFSDYCNRRAEDGRIYCKSLKSVIFEEGSQLNEIGRCAFLGCGLESIEIPGGTSIDFSAFAGCTDMTRVLIGDGVVFVGSGIFMNCTNLVDIIFAGSAEFDTDAPDVFRNVGATYIKIPEGVDLIPFATFYDCPNLQVVELPSTIEVFSNPFRDYFSLQRIIYHGTKAQFCQIDAWLSGGKYYHETSPEFSVGHKVQVQCTDGSLTITGTRPES